jgi:hypothetical protein
MTRARTTVTSTRSSTLCGWLVVGLAACTPNASGLGGGEVDVASPTSTHGDSSASSMTGPSPSTGVDGGGTSTANGDDLDTSTSTPATTTSDEPASSTTSSTEEGDGSTTSTAPQASLPGLRIDLHCMPGFCQFNPSDVCAMEPTIEDQAALEGEPGVTYDVTIRVRGVVEMSTYVGGTLDAGGNVYVGGNVDSYWSPFSLVVTDPPQTYWLNPWGEGDLFTYGVDYEYTLPIAHGAQVELHGGSGDDSCGLFNHDAGDAPIVVPGVPPAPLPFNGQFLQVDVESIVPVG